MNTNLDTAIATLINKSLEGVDASITFLQAEIPDYVYQLLLWYGVKSAIVASVFLVVVIGCVFSIVKLIKYSDNIDTPAGSAEGAYVLICLLGFVCFVSTFPFFTYALEALQIYIAPKVWLLEYASDLVK